MMKKPLLVLATALLAASFSFNASANSRGHEQSSHQKNTQHVTVVTNTVKHNDKQQQNRKDKKNQKVVIVKHNNHAKKTHQKGVKSQPSTSFSISFGNGVNTSIIIANAH
jgi:Ni/Co efflux regulator RcnB